MYYTYIHVAIHEQMSQIIATTERVCSRKYHGGILGKIVFNVLRGAAHLFPVGLALDAQEIILRS